MSNKVYGTDVNILDVRSGDNTIFVLAKGVFTWSALLHNVLKESGAGLETNATSEDLSQFTNC